MTFIHIINTSLATGLVPQTLVSKNKYRPITFLPIFSTWLENKMYDKLISFLNANITIFVSAIRRFDPSAQQDVQLYIYLTIVPKIAINQIRYIPGLLCVTHRELSPATRSQHPPAKVI